MATSPDGVRWTEHGAVLSASTMPEMHRRVWSPYVIEEGGVYYL